MLYLANSSLDDGRSALHGSDLPNLVNPMRLPLITLTGLALIGCKNEGTLVNNMPDAALEITSPSYGEFLGDGPISVRGTVSPPSATLMIEGELVQADEDGNFETEVDFDDAYRIIDADVSFRDITDRQRVPVFRGQKPIDTWPGSAVLQLTPAGLDVIGRVLGAPIDELGWEDQLLGIVPPIELGGFSIIASDITHEPTEIRLIPTDDGIGVFLTFVDISLIAETTIDIAGTPLTVPATFTYDEILIGGNAIPEINADGEIILSMGEGDLSFGNASVEITGLGPLPLDFLLDGIEQAIEPLADQVLSGVFGFIDGVSLGGPIDFEQDLFGTALSVKLSELSTSPNGLDIGLGMGIDAPAALGPVEILSPQETNPDIHLALGVHEALLDQALSEQVIGLVTQDLDLGGFLGNIIGVGILALPGGDDAPNADDGWCMAINPGTAHVVRAQDTIAPLATLYMPDVMVDVGIKDGDDCEQWLVASLAMNVNINVTNGTAIGIGFDVPEGAVLFYGADEDEWEEAAVVEGLGTFIVSSTSLLAGNLQFDIADILGGGLLGGIGIPGLENVALEPALISSTPMLDENGEQPEGQFSLGIQLFSE